MEPRMSLSKSMVGFGALVAFVAGCTVSTPFDAIGNDAAPSASASGPAVMDAAPTSDASLADVRADADACGLGAAYTIPVRVHLAKSTSQMLTATLTASEVPAVLAEVNALWAPACITFALESIPDDTFFSEASAALVEAAAATGDREEVARAFAQILPRTGKLERGVDVFIVQSMGIQALGRYFEGLDAVVWSDTRPGNTPSTRVPTERLILAHEFGHAMALNHYEGPGLETNLMQAGGQGDIRRAKDLLPEQIEAARKQATTGDAL